MKFNYTTKTLLLATAVFAIAWGGLITWHRMVQKGATPGHTALEQARFQLEFFGPIIAPIAFATFVMGRRYLSILSVVIFALIEVFAVVISCISMGDTPW
jgi:hypothetical protein